MENISVFKVKLGFMARIDKFTFHDLSSIHTELLAIAMQKWVEIFAKEWVEYPFLAMSANANRLTALLMLSVNGPLGSIHTEL